MPNDTLARWDRIAGRFTDCVNGVRPDQWSSPTPCDGWVARDVIVHLAEWVPPFLEAGLGVEPVPGPDPATDPAGTWAHVDAQVRALLTRPDADEVWFDHPMAGRLPLGDAVERFILGDVLVHTWDLARATGQDETLDAEMSAGMLAGMEPMADMLVASGHFGPRVEVAHDAPVQTRLLALVGRRA